MDVIDAIHSRRSIRSFQPRPVERAVIEAIIHDATQAPPPTREQVPWTFNVVQGVERIAAYGAEARAYAVAHHPDGPGWKWLDRADFKVFWDAPALIVISGPVEDCCRAGQNLMLSAHARGLGTCWVGSPMLWLVTEAAKAELGVPASVMPVAAICLGYAASVAPAPARGQPIVIWR
jgi:nitroreductase